MKKGMIWIALTSLILTSLVLAACAKTTTNSTTTTSTLTTATQTTTSTTKVTTTAPTTTTTTTASATGNWWASLGKPQYGGIITLRNAVNIQNFDPYYGETLTTIESAWMQRLFGDDWTLNPSVFDYKIDFRPDQYIKGMLAESWEFTAPSTFVVHLRHGVTWQNIPPVNGRPFVASDVVAHYDRIYGLGGVKGSPNYSPTVTNGLQSVTATDNYTVVFQYNQGNSEVMLETLEAVDGPGVDIEAPEAVQQWGDVSDWHHAIGTGPFILTDFVSGSSATLSKNPNYWGYDERYPQNQLPYVDGIRILIIPDSSTAEAGLRTGKIDGMEALSATDATQIEKTDPQILQVTIPLADADTIDPRNDVKPFSDIRVREAMQMAIDLPTIAKTYYGGFSDPSPSTLISNFMTGWGFPYSQWPQDLKDQYAYNPTKAKQLLSDAGYPNGFNTDIVVTTDSDLDLLQIVKSYFAAVGINMDVRTMDPTSWTAYAFVGRKQDQLAMRAAGALGHTFQPSRQLIHFVFTYVADYENVKDPQNDAFYAQALAATNINDYKKIVSDMNEYIAQQHYCISLLQPDVFNLYWPWLKGYNGQTHSISKSGAGAQFLGFYCARFWIDQNLKKSMGY